MKRVLVLFLAIVSLASLVWVGIPMVLIRPFGAQTPRGLAISYAMRGRGGALTLALLVAGLAATVFLWRRLRTIKGRIATGLAVVSLAGCAWLARQNYFEWMFRPLADPAFARAADSKDVADDDLILGVVSGSRARAYPVRALAYHHVVNDVLDDEPIVATY